MTPQKPKVPKNEVYNVYYEKTFFGDEQAQARAVETITRGLGENTGKIYIIAGPIRSGKGTVYQRLLEQPADMLPARAVLSG